MKILLISSNSSPRGGGEKYLVFMAAGLRQNGCQVEALLSAADYMDGWARELTAAGATVHRLPLTALRDRKLRFVQSMLAFSQQRQIAGFCREIKPDYILVNQQYDEDSLDYIRGAQLAGTAMVASILHLPMTRAKNARPLGRLRGWLMRWWYGRYAPLMLFSTIDSRHEFFDYYRLSLPSDVLLSGVPLDRKLPEMSEVRRRLSDPWVDAAFAAPARLPVIGVACQFVPQKNLPVLAAAFVRCNAETPRCRLLLIGDGPERSRLESILKGVPSELYHITGWGDKYADYLYCLDLFVMPSCFESTPLALVESVGHGTPALIARFNGSTELIAAAKYVSVWEGKDDDIASLAAAIGQKLDRLEQDRQTGEEQRGEYCDYFSPSQMAGRLLTLFQKHQGK